LARLGRREDASAMLDGDDQALVAGRALLAAGRPLGAAIATPAAGFAGLLVALAVDLSRDDSKALPIALAQVARHADPGSTEATLLLALLLDGDKREDDALAVLATIRATDPLAGDALDLETRLLSDARQYDAALKRAQAATLPPGATAADYGRLAAIYADMERHADAAATYAEAIRRSPTNSWTMRLLRAASLEQIDRWPEARVELETAMRTEPDNAVLLNFLGYGKLERGEDLDAAEAMIRKASALKPDDASITDSLGWAMYKRGRLPEAVMTLTKAAVSDPGQAEIHEHLGDALFASGRRIEARFSWSAALLTAEDKDKARLQAKLDTGLTAATSAP
jgi:tetratricopeptide (TPR) repeat protein